MNLMMAGLIEDAYAPLATVAFTDDSSYEHQASPLETLYAQVQSVNSSDITSPTLEKRLSDYQVHIRIGGPMQHVGTLQK